MIESRNYIMKDLRELMDFLIKNNVTNYAEFIEYCIKNKRYDWFRLATDSHYLAVTKLIDGIARKIEN
ncbi:hypothetical protein HYH11_10230 [Lactobacillus salivarius]|uniref:hypothetical protein n=2 Tax=Ligilactobacillus salivarius TaxID=1624 RepID=UPI001473A23C|nr:hypothetical protein [Ligilactobacillus salivarius]NME23519.1 hypothetical protein [Ligilactobacillus salivarius]NXZ97267.1 hypothetical protein [Ligilactobacillus salivarius]NYA60037.1 hypothetical protein [Ligilactobacillus salivarius]NYA61781.1 hypothetical protein [Ligilactobacillus salivarius]NYA68577.1 hypothetical protein [Ligilactobacillus salivarius]